MSIPIGAFAGTFVPLVALLSSSCTIIFDSSSTSPSEDADSLPADSLPGSGYEPSNLTDFSLASESVDCEVRTGETWILDTNSAEIRLDDAPLAADRAPALKSISLVGGTSAVVLGCRNFVLESGATLKGEGLLAIIVLAKDEITLQGTVDVAAKGPSSGPGFQLLGTPEQPHNSRVRGPGGCYGSLGGAGDYETEHGSVYGTPELVPLLGGSPGGDTPGIPEGGGGGGAIQFSAGSKLLVAGLINAGGGGGGGAGLEATYQAGSGGGSGGAVLLEAPLLLIEQSAYVGVNGGGGGGGSDSFNEPSNGKPGDDGSQRPALGGEAQPASRAGGDGSYASAAGRRSQGGDLELSGGGGGGGAGRIRINTRGKSAADYPWALSPPLGEAPTTLGEL